VGDGLYDIGRDLDMKDMGIVTSMARHGHLYAHSKSRFFFKKDRFYYLNSLGHEGSCSQRYLWSDHPLIGRSDVLFSPSIGIYRSEHYM
jgi:hypothetical protein